MSVIHKLFRLDRLSSGVLLTFLLLAPPAHAASFYVQHNLVTDDQSALARRGFAPADFVDPNLVNPWGVSFSATGPFWVSNNGTGTSTLYNSAGQPQTLVVTIPAPGGGTSKPTGQVFNGTSDFTLSTSPSGPARFLFATEDGTIAGWNGNAGTTAITMVDNSGSDAIYKGLALGSVGSNNFLYAANFHAGTVDVFNKNFTLTSTFTDSDLALAGYAPFNIQNINGNLYVAYAEQDANREDEVAGAGLGYVDEFDTSGNLVRRIASGGTLNAPWGIALAPADFGEFSNDLLVGNFGDGHISAFDPNSGAFLGQLEDSPGNPIAIEGLWALIFGNGVNGGARDKLYFTAGIDDEAHGLFGFLAVPEPGTVLLLSAGLPAVFVPFRRRR